MAMRHWAWHDDLRSRFRRRAACGAWVHNDDVARRGDDVTCDDCKKQLAAFDALALDDDEPTINPS